MMEPLPMGYENVERPMFRNRIFKVLSNLVLFLVLFTGQVGAAPIFITPPDKENVADGSLAFFTAKCLNAEGLKQQKDPRNNKLRFVGAKSGKPIQHPDKDAVNRSPEEAARGYLKQCGGLFGVQDESLELKTRRIKELEHGRSVARFQQSVNAVPVLGGEMVVQMDADKNITAIVSELTEAPLDNANPSVDADSATQIALEVVAQNNKLDLSVLSASTPELWFYDPALLEIDNGQSPALVWRLEVSVAGKPINELLLVDAQTEAVLLRFNQIDALWASTGGFNPTQTTSPVLDAPAYTLGSPLISIYTLNQTTGSLPGFLVCDQSDPGQCAGDADAQAAYQFTLDAYNFYANTHGRDSIDGLGMELVSSVHYGVSYQNAFWNGSQMTYGDGFVVDDVVAHELTHGVTENESGLIYYGQSGAINESFSDIWGEFVDQTNTGGMDGAAYNWQIGEDISGIGAFRNMQDPTIFGNPDRMGSPNYYNGTDDNGGVHSNSGVNNKAAYLMTAGGTFNGHTVTGIGIEKAAKIYYEAQFNLLTSAATYSDLYNVLNQACSNLQTLTVVTASDCVQVDNAALAVEMDVVPTISFTTCSAVTQIPTTECEALVALYNSADGANWYDNTGWLQTNTPCSWYGVDCWGETNVKQLYLNDNGLTGSIPSELGNLHHLGSLELRRNALHGEIPASFTEANLGMLWAAQFDCEVYSTNDNVIAFLNKITPNWINRCKDSYENDNEFAKAKWIAFGAPQTHSLYPANEDHDYVKFTLTRPAGITLETSGQPGYDTEIALYDNAYNLIGYDNDGGDLLYSRVVRACNTNPLPAGTYYAMVYNYEGVIPEYQVTANIERCVVLHVKTEASGAGDCSTWDNACTLNTALDNAVSGDEIWVSAGTHKPTTANPDPRYASFHLKSEVSVYGGFAGTETLRSQRNPVTHVTILSGDIDNNDSQTPIITDLATVTGNTTNSYNVVIGANDATLDGFTITSGNANGISCPSLGCGGGMVNEYSNPTLINITFIGNSAGLGGGMYNYWYSNPTLTDVTFIGNSAHSGGGMYNNWYSNPSLTNVTFSNNSAVGYGSQGGGMYSYYSNPTLTDVTFSGNSVYQVIGGVSYNQGGGMYNWHSKPTLTNITFNDNSATGSYGQGGGMYNWDSSLILTNVTFSDNSASGAGGGMYNRDSSSTLTNVTFSGNSVAYIEASIDGGGGGMYNRGSGDPALSLTLTDVTFIGNSAGYGAGMLNTSGNLTLTNVIFSGNTAVRHGGGMSNYYNYNSGNPTLTNVTFNNNSAGEDGGGMYNVDSSPTLTNVTFSGNTAGYGGGGMHNNNGSSPILTNITINGNSADRGGGIFNQLNSIPQVRNTILWGNTAVNGGSQIYSDGVTNLSYSVIQGGYASGTHIITDDPLLGMFGDYGGFTQTIPLLTGSSAVGAGDANICPETDQRGINRPQGACDIGAFEGQVPTVRITGNAGVADASLSYAGRIATANGIGGYTLIVQQGWSGTVTPFKTGYTFDPASKSFTNVQEDQLFNYTATLIPICATVTQIPESECEALVALYVGTDGVNWINNTGWLQTNTPCNWYGVYCAAGTNVTGLYLWSNQLNGSIPPELGDLVSLSSLYLYGNQLSGSIPPELGSLTSLYYLYLQSNQLSGSTPPELGGLINLRSLDLSNNQLSGSIPTTLGSPVNLRYLDLSQNQLSGSIPTALSGLVNLRGLYLSGNELSGSIPTELGSLPSIQTLDLHRNQLSGSVPSELGNLHNLAWLDFRDNDLYGELPASFTKANLGALWKAEFDCEVYSTNDSVISFLESITPNWITRCKDAYENDDSFAKAKQIIPGMPQTHSLYPFSGDHDYVKFTITSVSGITLETSGLDGYDTEMALYDSNYNLIGYDNDGGNLLYSKIAHPCGTDPLPMGTYYAMIYNYEGVIPEYQATLNTEVCTQVVSITRVNPNPTNATSVNFIVTFSKDVADADATDFSLVATGVTGASITNVAGAGTTRIVTVSTGTGDGTIRLDVPVGASINDLAGNPLDGLPFTGGEIYTVDGLPFVSSITRIDNNPNSAANMRFTVTFSEPVTGMNTGAPFNALNLIASGITGAGITSVSGSGATYTVTVDTGSGSGTLRLDVASGAAIKDLTGNSLTGLPFTSGETYTVNKPPLSTIVDPYTSCADVNRTHGKLVIPPAGNLGMTISNNSDFTVRIKSVTIDFNDNPLSQQIHEIYLGGNRLWSQNNVSMDGSYTFTAFSGNPTIPPNTTLMLAVTKWASETQMPSQAYIPSTISIERIVVKFQPVDSKDPSSACQDLDSSDAASLSPVTTDVNAPVNGLGAAAPIAPIGNIGANYNPTFTWNKVNAATYYRLYIKGSNGSVWDQWYPAADICDATTCSVTRPTLEGGNYMWYVQTYNASGLGPWSNNAQPTNFTSTPPTTPAEVTLTAPSGTITNHAPTYQWNRVSTATWYRLYVSGPGGVVKDQWYQAVNICNSTTCSVSSPTLASGAHVWWVQAYNTAGYSQWRGANFTVSP